MSWLLLRVRWRRHWASSLGACLLIGAIGGFVLASAASARRVGSAYQTLIDEIGAPDLAVIPGCDGASTVFGCAAPSDLASGDDLVERLGEIAVVERARSVETVLPFFVDGNGAPLLATADDANGCYDGDRKVQLVLLGAGGPTDQALPFRLEGEMPASGSGGVVLTRATAEREGLGIGQEVRLAGWCKGDGDVGVFDAPIDLRITGLSIGPLDVEPPGTGVAIEPAHVDPAVFHAMVAAGAEPQPNVVVWLDPTATPEIVVTALASFEIVIDFRERAELFDRALAIDARLLWLLAGIGSIGGFLVLAPVVAKNLRDTGPETATLAALGARRPQIAQQALLHAGSLGVIGALLSAVLAVPLSALMPRGLSAAIASERELWFDGVVTATGVGLVVVVVVVIGSVPAWRIGSAHRAATSRVSDRSARLVGLLPLRPADRSGVAAAIGAPVDSRQASPWPTLASMMMVGAAGVASLTYLAGLRHLEQSPSLVGWNWDAMVSFDFRPTTPGQNTSTFARIEAIDAVERVTAGTSYPPWFLFVPDTRTVVWPWSFATGPDAITPSMASGRAPDGPDEVAIDPTFADKSGLEVGDILSLGRQTLASRIAEELPRIADESGVDAPHLTDPEDEPVTAEFEITGIAVVPFERSQDIAQATFTLEGYADLVEPDPDEVAAARAWLPSDLSPELRSNVEELLSNLGVKDRTVYLRFSGDVQSAAAAVAAVDGVPEVVAPTPDEVVTLIVGLNLTRNDRVPMAMAITVAGAFVALASYLLFAAARTRRFELAVLRALGLSAAGVHRSIAAQATATAAVTLIVAIPVGVVVGRAAWMAYARDLDVVPVSVTPWSTIAAVAVATIAVSNLAALVPGWHATKRSVGRDLCSE